MTVNIINATTDADGRQIVKPTTAKEGATMYYSGPSFTAAKDGSGVWNSRTALPPFTESNRPWHTVKLYDSSGIITTTETDAKMTVLDVLIQEDIELIGGALAIPNILPVGNDDFEWKIWVYGAPEIPSALGGAIPFVEDILLKDFYEGEDIIIDGRTPKLLKYRDTSNLPIVQYLASLHDTAHPAIDLAAYMTAIGYDGSQHVVDDLIVLNIGETNTDLWVSHIHNGGTAGDETDFGVGDLNYGWWENELRFVIQHPTGLNPSVTPGDVAKFQVILDTFIKW
jgi:hypothetical protein